MIALLLAMMLGCPIPASPHGGGVEAGITSDTIASTTATGISDATASTPPPPGEAGRGLTSLRDSLDALRREIATMPYSADLHLRKAAINMELGQWDYASEEYSLVLSKEPDNLAALFYRAYAHNKMRRHALAEADYKAFLRMAPLSMEGMLGLANTYLMQGKQQDALDQMNHMVELCPDSAVAYASRASLERDMGSLDASLYDWDEAIRLRPRDPELMLSKADVLLRLGRKDEARDALDAIVALGTPRGLLREWYEKTR